MARPSRETIVRCCHINRPTIAGLLILAYQSMTQTPSISYKRHRFPPQIVAHAAWLYLRFGLSLREAGAIAGIAVVARVIVDFDVAGAAAAGAALEIE